MKLTLTAEYKSLKPFDVEITDFSILTGVNGAGKSQILEGINNREIKLTEGNITLDPKLYITHDKLFPSESKRVEQQNIIQEHNTFWQHYSKARGNQIVQAESLSPEQFKSRETSLLQSLCNNFDPSRRNMEIHSMCKIILDKIAKGADKSILELNEDDIYKNYPVNGHLAENNIFNQDLSLIFKRYHKNYLDNFTRCMQNEKKGTKYSCLSDAEFEQKYGESPWGLINRFLQTAKLNYKINTPEDNDRDTPFQVKLINSDNNVEINFSQLSSGEKTLFSLVIALYNSTKEYIFPKLLLLDEPDAFLHPSMSKTFLDVVQKEIVGRLGIKVIMVTHSPSTVALAPQDSIYIVNKLIKDDKKPQIEKVSKDHALKLLTEGVPSFSVNYENRRQVFVESEYDVGYYESLYKYLSNKLNPEISLSFIASSKSKIDENGNGISSCAQVKQIVKSLRDNGNNFIYGVIDWDNKNNGNDHISVLGKNRRYSIENYILDPLLVAAYLNYLKELSPQDIGLAKDEKYYNFVNLEESKLQSIVDFVVNRIFPGDTSSKVDCELVSGRKVQIAETYLKYKGHDLENEIKSKFKPLNKYSRSDAELKNNILEFIIADFPELLSKDLLDLLVELQNN